MTLFLSLCEKPAEKELPVDPAVLDKIVLQKGCLRLSKLVCRGLKNVEIGLFGKNDPFVEIQFANKLPAKTRTKTVENAGSDATWLDQKFQITASKREFIDELIRFDVYDENALLAKAFIGGAAIPAHKFLVNMNELVPVKMELKDKKVQHCFLIWVFLFLLMHFLFLVTLLTYSFDALLGQHLWRVEDLRDFTGGQAQ